MALNNKAYDISQLAEITENGFTAALFPQIRDAYALKMMEIYGNDIDISSASADGQFINMEALILNNIYRTLETIDRNMNPSTASGKYLDILCGFSNIYRQNETFSTCQVYIKNISSEEWRKKSITFIDKNNLEWIWYNPINFEREYIESIKAGEVRTITVTCKTLGANMAYGTGISYGDAINSNSNFLPISVDYIGVFNVSDMIRKGIKNDNGIPFANLTNEEIKSQLDFWVENGFPTVVENLVSNGDLLTAKPSPNQNEPLGFEYQGATDITLSGGIATFTATEQFGKLTPSSVAPFNTTDIFYNYAKIKSSNRNVGVLNTNARLVSHSGSGLYELLSSCGVFQNVYYLGQVVDYNTTDFWNNLTKDNTGDIYQAIGSDTFKVYQVSNAIPGKTRETDSQLRSKKLNLIGNGSQTILESLKSKLLSIEGISDCFVTHNVGGTVELDDGISVGKHHVYIALRYETGVNVSPWDIGSTIYKALTPGVPTQKYEIIDSDNDSTTIDNEYGVSKSQKIAVTNNQTIDIYWKKCKANNPEIEITFDTKLEKFTPQQENLIKSVLKDFLNNIGLDDSISTTEIQTLFMSADLKNGGLSTYFSTGCSIEGLVNNYKNHLTYCEYTNDDFKFDYKAKKLIIKTVEGEV